MATWSGYNGDARVELGIDWASYPMVTAGMVSQQRIFTPGLEVRVDDRGAPIGLRWNGEPVKGVVTDVRTESGFGGQRQVTVRVKDVHGAVTYLTDYVCPAEGLRVTVVVTVGATPARQSFGAQLMRRRSIHTQRQQVA